MNRREQTVCSVDAQSALLLCHVHLRDLLLNVQEIGEDIFSVKHRENRCMHVQFSEKSLCEGTQPDI